MAYIGFFLIMAGLAAAGGALDKGVSFATAAAMTAEGAALMWLFREPDEDSGENGDDPVSDGGSPADRPASGSEGRSGADRISREVDDDCIYL